MGGGDLPSGFDLGDTGPCGGAPIALSGGTLRRRDGVDRPVGGAGAAAIPAVRRVRFEATAEEQREILRELTLGVERRKGPRREVTETRLRGWSTTHRAPGISIKH